MTVPIVFLISDSVKYSRSIVLFGGITSFFERITVIWSVVYLCRLEVVVLISLI